ncbi:MAG: undecaprenyldiphospho-muramoylpentapeptide beta-N-acetylglucosaminyltransferase [Candidatus Kapaibacteriales bacterium]
MFFAAGGTGGHLFPAIAVAEELSQVYGVECKFFGTDRMEKDIIPKNGFDFYEMPIGSPPKSIVQKATYAIKLAYSIAKCATQLKSNKAKAVVCAGAYISVPPGLAASITNTPLFLMESNVNLGKANKMLTKQATRIFTSYDKTKDYVNALYLDKVKNLGNPVRKEIKKYLSRETHKSNLGFDPSKRLCLIMGGSLGALSINKAVEENLDFLLGEDLQILWQTGKNYTPPKNLPKGVIVTEFIDDMSTVYNAADFAICRSGATTCSELKAVYVPAILIPLPSAGSGEQILNARALESEGKALVLEEKDLGNLFTETVTALTRNGDKLGDMRRSGFFGLNKKTPTQLIAEAIASEIGLSPIK